MERVALPAAKRNVGKGAARKLRREGAIPAILYGRTKEPVALSVPQKDFERFVKVSPDLTSFIDLSVDGGKAVLAMLRDYQADIIRRDFTHLDLQLVDQTQKIELEVPIHFVGTPVGVKDEGGVLEVLRRRIHIKALPDRVPAHIELDVSVLKIGQSIHADEVALPQGVEFPHTTNYTIVTVVPPAKEEVPVAAAVPAEGVAAEGAEAAPAGAEVKKEGEAKAPTAGKAAAESSKEKKS